MSVKNVRMIRLVHKTNLQTRTKAVRFYPFIFNGMEIIEGRFLFWTEDGAAQSERRAISFVFPSQSSVGNANRMHTVVDDRYYSYYAYDYSGGSCGSREQSQACLGYAEMQQRRRSQRRLKLTGESHSQDINADFMATYAYLDNPTLYPSAYLVLTSRGYTKHYYAGADLCGSRVQSQTRLSYAEMKQSVHCKRVAARIGGG